MTHAELLHCDYAIDADDRIVGVDGEWDDFARENDAAALVRERIEGNSIWDHITGADTRQIYHDMFDRLRHGAPPITFGFRCDSPTLRRFMSLTLRAGNLGEIHLRATLLRTESRQAVDLLDQSTPDDDVMQEMCSFCKKAKLPTGEWAEVETLLERFHWFESNRTPKLSHSVCPQCTAAFQTRLTT